VDDTDLRERLRDFAKARDWDQFHTPKNLAMALAAEVGELLEIFQWLSDQQAIGVKDDAAAVQAVREELADIVIYAVRLADVLSIDLEEATRLKVDANERRYPVELARGNALKYDRRPK